MRNPLCSLIWAASVSCACALDGASAQSGTVPVGPRAFGAYPSVAQMTEQGRLIFMDAGLSASGRLACAACHDPAHHFAPGDLRATQSGGADLTHPGGRAVPSLQYLQLSIPFTEHFIDDDDGHGIDAGPTGGLTWDARVDSPHAQALLPLFDANEMANRDARELAARLARAPYAGAFREAFSAPGGDVFENPDQVVRWITAALEVYQQSAADFYPFTSKFDAFLRRQTSLSDAELRGLALFNNPNKGNCASCHPSTLRASGAFPLFSDAGSIALGVPRNRQIAANRDPHYFDLGLCGPLRHDLASHPEYCGRFKTPSLRNVATRLRFFHNGALRSLRSVVEFYATRDTDPGRWYGRRNGHALRYDDLPTRYQENVNKEAPFAPLPGGRARLNAHEIDDIVVFLQTLTDGWVAGQDTASASDKGAARVARHARRPG
jgi:cytochrome c peroxidase